MNFEVLFFDANACNNFRIMISLLCMRIDACKEEV